MRAGPFSPGRAARAWQPWSPSYGVEVLLQPVLVMADDLAQYQGITSVGLGSLLVKP